MCTYAIALFNKTKEINISMHPVDEIWSLGAHFAKISEKRGPKTKMIKEKGEH